MGLKGFRKQIANSKSIAYFLDFLKACLSSIKPAKYAQAVTNKPAHALAASM